LPRLRLLNAVHTLLLANLCLLSMVDTLLLANLGLLAVDVRGLVTLGLLDPLCTDRPGSNPLLPYLLALRTLLMLRLLAHCEASTAHLSRAHRSAAAPLHVCSLAIILSATVRAAIARSCRRRGCDRERSNARHKK
jgi:hypothetical protein